MASQKLISAAVSGAVAVTVAAVRNLPQQQSAPSTISLDCDDGSSSAERGQATATVVTQQPLNNPRAQRPENTPWPNIGLIVFATFCCHCTDLILGTNAYDEYVLAKTAYESGRYSEAEAHGRKARKQVWIAIVIGTIATVIALAIMAVIVYLKVPNSVS